MCDVEVGDAGSEQPRTVSEGLEIDGHEDKVEG